MEVNHLIFVQGDSKYGNHHFEIKVFLSLSFLAKSKLLNMIVTFVEYFMLESCAFNHVHMSAYFLLHGQNNSNTENAN